MNAWLKAITAISAVVCFLSLVVLSGLALRTTDGPAAGTIVPEALPVATVAGQAGGTESEATLQLLSGLLPLIADQGNQLIDRLTEINNTAGVVPHELLLTFKSADALAAFRARAAGEGLRVLSSDPRLLSARVHYDDAGAMSRELTEHADDYENIGPNFLAWVPGLPEEAPQTDAANAGGRQPFGNSGMEAIGADGDRSNWGRGVTVAVLDTGITDHPSLSQTQVTHYDLVKDGQDPNGHGTAMASLVAGEGEDGGAAPASQLVDMRVADVKGESNTALLAQAIMQAVDQHVGVISISLGTSGDAIFLRNAVAYALQHGVVIVAAAGNDQQTRLSYPAAYPGVISVGAMDAEAVQAYFSNSGETLTISAPGVGIVSGYSNGRTVIGSGTSQAAAITSGVVAALLSRGHLPQNITQVLSNAAKVTGAPKAQVGAGLIQVPKN